MAMLTMDLLYHNSQKRHEILTNPNTQLSSFSREALEFRIIKENNYTKVLTGSWFQGV